MWRRSPPATRNLAAFSSQLNGVTSNSLTPLPISLFNDPRHYTAVGSAIVSRLVAQELNAVARRNPQIYNPPEAGDSPEGRTPAPSPNQTIARLQPAHFRR
jgi:hypothetical protein